MAAQEARAVPGHEGDREAVRDDSVKRGTRECVAPHTRMKPGSARAIRRGDRRAGSVSADRVPMRDRRRTARNGGGHDAACGWSGGGQPQAVVTRFVRTRRRGQGFEPAHVASCSGGRHNPRDRFSAAFPGLRLFLQALAAGRRDRVVLGGKPSASVSATLSLRSRLPAVESGGCCAMSVASTDRRL